VADAEAAVEAGADLLGLNFYAGSKRRIDLANARAIAAAVAGRALIVGVFVNHSAAEIHTIAQSVPLDVVQLHGDEPPSLGAELRTLDIIEAAKPHEATSPARCQLWRAVRCRDEAMTAAVVEWVKAFEVAAGQPLDALLVDAYDATEYGGTGKRADLSVFAALRQRLPHLPLWLAGGLTPENVASAIESAGPAGVDTASGVESAPGVKDADRMRRFVAAVLAAKPIARRTS
jgi:phosphoribosylanthranilate isomerase